jgi:rhomboid protease GluP
MKPQQYTRVLNTWLSRRPGPWAPVISAAATLSLAVLSIIYWKDIGSALSWMPATREAVFEQHAIWRAWSALFAHADGKHLLSNSFLFFILGSFLTGYFGSFMFPFLAFIMGGVVNLIVLPGMSPTTQLLGASGVVFWMGGAWLSLYILLDQKRSLYQRGLRAAGVALLLFFPAEAFDPHISYGSHFWGFALGLLSGATFYLYHRKKFLAAIDYELIVEAPESPITDEVDHPYPLQL